MSLWRLSESAKTLYKIILFLNPNYIEESFLKDGALKVDDPDLAFMLDEKEFVDAREALREDSLVNKSSESGIISMHRILQHDAISRMTLNQLKQVLYLSIDILSAHFPDTYSADVGYQAASWSYSLKKFDEKGSLAYASAIDLRGLINLDICRPTDALESFKEAYKLRTAILPDNDPFLAASQVNIGITYTELGEHEKAREHLQQSIDIRLMHDSDRIGNSYSNMASLLLKIGDPNGAEAMLKSCPSLKDFSVETFLKTRNPRFSGDMVLLSRIKFEQGLLDESLRFASKALTFRKSCLSERLKVCDSLHQVAVLLHRRDNTESAVQPTRGMYKNIEKAPTH
ncbi:hypothetical protein P168DRAFT_316615 [Aspergillus campestris IBT 28561]|uniref:DUF7779 domain-containing protein n=1 Tax=Aspergillus campestris (strain IBT 28561) TaxID=1392248 RepID=A0A2I1D9R2_ASPC2|nr:uncharacterized protein P168DRAFT_316615 [Aspergillus campestris IBT 28561]PKY06620.1 hypothetical protein P168DRAFT_316615 [Aspergillus campestris IBT 28561]